MEARQIFEQIKAHYKPRLKVKSKNELIDLICTLSMEVAGLKHELKKHQPEEASKENAEANNKENNSESDKDSQSEKN